MKGYIAFVTREHEPLIIATAAQGARACVGHIRGHLTAAKSDYLRERRFKSEAVQCACLGRIACRIQAALGLGVALACLWRLNQAAQAWNRPMGTPP